MPEFIANLAVIGAGQLGSRHLQALCKASFPARIWVVDPVAAALTVAKQRAAEMTPETQGKVLSFHQAMADLPETLDLAVVATSSLVRLAVLRELLARSRPANLLLEKVTFCSEPSWRTAAELIAGKQVNTWVNCPRRMNPDYRRLREKLHGTGPLRMTVAGVNYGLACSAIHFIDLFAFLCGTDEYRFATTGLVREIFPSKRSGYIEIFGRLTVAFAGGHELVLECRNEPAAAVDFAVHLEAPGLDLTIDEIRNRVELRRDDHGVCGDFSYHAVYQSNLTNLLAEELLRHGTCPLTSFTESMRLHLTMLAGLSAFYAEVTGQPVAELPIT